MNIQDWNPFLRFARQQDNTLLQGLLQAIDHRILYFHSGSGHIEAKGQLYPIGPGTLIYMPAGTAYRYIFKNDPPVYSGFNFDFFQNSRNLNTPLPPVFHQNFCKEQILEASALELGTVPQKCIWLENAFSFEDSFLLTAKEFRTHNLYYDARCSALLKDILIRTVRQEASIGSGIPGQKADAILQYIHQNYRYQLKASDLGAKFGYHENYISTLVLRHTGLTLHQYLLNYRMQAAVGLLQSTDLTVTEIAEQVGMSDIKHFSKTFKKMMGHPPSRFRG